MASIVKELTTANLLDCDYSNTDYEVIMGSHAYGLNKDDSDFDVYSVVMPKHEDIFPYNYKTALYGFGPVPNVFKSYQNHHIADPNGKAREYDVTIYSIVKYFNMAMDASPNIIDSLFVPENCILNITEIGKMIRDNRKLFVSKKIKHTYLGYAYQQMKNAQNRQPTGKRLAIIEQYGWDVKYLYHVRRLVQFAEQLMLTGELNTVKDNEVLKCIRQGLVSPEDVFSWMKEKETYLEKLYETSTIQHMPDQAAIHKLLLNCVEHKYGSIERFDKTSNKDEINTLKEIQKLISKHI